MTTTNLTKKYSYLHIMVRFACDETVQILGYVNRGNHVSQQLLKAVVWNNLTKYF